MSREPTTKEALVLAIELARKHLAANNRIDAEHDLYRAKALLEQLNERIDRYPDLYDTEAPAEDVRFYTHHKMNYKTLEAEARRRGWWPMRGNPAGLTPKGERMYEHIKRSYAGDPTNRTRAKEIAARTVMARASEGVPGLKKRAKNPDLPAAIDGYERFHQWEPKEIGELPGLVIPRSICVVGEMEQVMYHSDKWENKDNDYYHDHDPEVMCGRTDTEDGHVTYVPSEICDAKALYMLGKCIQYSYVDFDGEVVEAKFKPMPELYAIPSGKALLVINPEGRVAKVLAIIWGGKLDVQDVGIVG